METKKEIYKYLMSVKKGVGYIPAGYIVNAYGVKINTDSFDKSVKRCTEKTYQALKNKPIWRYS